MPVSVSVSISISDMGFVLLLCFILVTQMSALVVSCPKCGNMEVPYPLSTSDSCGDPRYRVYCDKGVLQFKSALGIYYKILSINQYARKMVISPPVIQKNTCYSSDVLDGGLRLDEDLPFNISALNTVMLLNCSENILLSPLNCSSKSFCRLFEEAARGRECKGTLCCHYLKDSSMNSHQIRVRIGGCTAYTSVIDIKPDEPVDLWNFGVELQWLPPF